MPAQRSLLTVLQLVFIVAFVTPALNLPVLQAAPQAPAQPAPNASEQLSGNWQFVLATEGGERIIQVSMQLDAERVSGKWDSRDVPDMGTYKGKELLLSFKHTVEDVQTTDTLALKGKFEGADLKGTWTFAQYSGMFVATRTNN